MKHEFIKRLISSIILIPIVLFFVIKGLIYFNFFILICLIITLYEWYMMSKNKPYIVPGLIFIFFSFYTVYFLRNEFNEDYLYFLMILGICIFTDIGGYFFGKIFKGPKLTKISPNKTYSGMIGGYFLSLISLSYFMNWINEETSINWFIVTILISSISQIGDIIISYFKRLSKIKNTGKIIPGHGGLLDRIDGMIFAFPFFYIIELIEFLN